jgi:hypothetical protein
LLPPRDGITSLGAARRLGAQLLGQQEVFARDGASGQQV